MNEIQIQSTPARLEVNFEELRDSLISELQKYDLVVTAETVKEAKQLAADLNKTAKLIDDRLKAEIAAASEPIRRVDEQRKELVSLCKNGRQKLIDQAKKFEDEKRALALDSINRYRLELWNDFVVNPEFQNAKVDDLAILTALTQKDNLTSATRAAVRSRVEADKALQDQTDRRILSLENECYRAGLAAPLTRIHVEAFLFADDDTYNAKLANLIQGEIRRQEAAEKRERERIEREEAQRKRQELDRQQREQEAEARRIENEKTEQQQTDQTNCLSDAAELAAINKADREALRGTSEPIRQAAPTPEWVRVTAVFEIQVPNTASNRAVEATLRNRLADAGFESEPKITVERLG